MYLCNILVERGTKYYKERGTEKKNRRAEK